MSSHLGKRPLGSPSGKSPPDKRSRPSEPRSALQNRYANLRKSKMPSPPTSRKTSFTGRLPKPSTGHQLSSDHNTSAGSVHGRRFREELGRDNQSSLQDARVMSPSSLGSKSSAPTNYVAPRAPSRLPVESTQHSSAMHDNTPISMQSLRKLKDRRRAIANSLQDKTAEEPSTVNTRMEVKLKAQQLDISQLRKERDELTNRLKRMEECFDRFNRVADRVEQEEKVSEALPPVVARLRALETSTLTSDVRDRQYGPGQLKPATDRLATIEAALPSLQQDVTRLKHDHAKTYSKPSTKVQASAGQVDLGKLVARVDQLVKDRQHLQEAVQGYSSLKSTLMHTDKRLANVEQTSQKVEALKGQTTALQTSLADLDKRLKSTPAIARQPRNLSEAMPSSATESLGQQISGIESELDSFFTSLKTIGDKVHEHDGAIKIVQDVVPELFEKQFDPFKLMVEKQLSAIHEKLATYAQVQHYSFDEEQQSQLRALTAKTVTLRNEMTTLQSENQDNIVTLAKKADAVAVKREMDGITFAFRDLESRYQNISTDDIYQRMVHWFGETYPTSATMLHNAAQTQKDISHLKAFHDQVSWILSRSNDLRYLCHNTAQLQSLVDSASQLQALVQQGSPQALAKIDQARTDAQTAITEAGRAVAKVDEHVQTSGKAMSLLHTSMQQLKSADSPLAKAEALRALETTVQTLQENLRTEEAEYSTKLQELRKTFSDEHDQRVKVEQRIKEDVNELKPRVAEVVKQVSEVQAAASQHRSEFDETNNKYIEPNRDFFGLFGTVLTVLAQLQQVVEKMNQNLPVAPLQVEWECYLPTLGEPAETNSETGNGNRKEQDKSKQ